MGFIKEPKGVDFIIQSKPPDRQRKKRNQQIHCRLQSKKQEEAFIQSKHKTTCLTKGTNYLHSICNISA